MRTTLHTEWTVDDVSKGFVYDQNEGKGLFGLGGQLIIQPEYQRNYIYGDGKKDVAVVESLLKGYPLGLLYFVQNADGKLEVLDGQQRITSFARFVRESWRFAVNLGEGKDRKPYYFGSLPANLRERITSSQLTVYVCEGEPDEIEAWFKTINIAGVPLVEQELRNAAYHGPFVTAARKVLSNTNDARMRRWSTYVAGDPRRQAVLERALDWASGGDIDGYMNDHRDNAGGAADALVRHFETVIDWASSTFDCTDGVVRGLEWGRLYETYHSTPYDHDRLNERISELLDDEDVTNKRGVFEYVLGGEKDTKLLHVRVFDQRTKKAVYARQTADARARDVSNCPLCAIGNDANARRIYKLNEMDADHVAAWSRGGATDEANCQMLCKTHNRAKGNR